MSELTFISLPVIGTIPGWHDYSRALLTGLSHPGRLARLEGMTQRFRIFVSGASGTIGLPLVRALVQAGHDVTAQTRSPEKQRGLETLGATPVLADALNAEQLTRGVMQARPTHVIHQLTALPKDGPRRARDVEPTNRLRIEGTRNLLSAAIAAGAQRFIGGSFALLAGDPASAPPILRDAVAAVASMESQILEASRSEQIEGIVLRYGCFYGPDVPMAHSLMSMVRRRLVPVVRDDRGSFPCIHLSDAVAATVAALEFGAPGGVYEIVDDHPVSMSDVIRMVAAAVGAPAPLTVPAWVPRLMAPYLSAITSQRMAFSNQNARRALRWQPAFASIRDGVADTLRRAA